MGVCSGGRLESVFSEFERVPIGTASIGQVHRAVLREDCDCCRGRLELAPPDDGAGGRVLGRLDGAGGRVVCVARARVARRFAPRDGAAYLGGRGGGRGQEAGSDKRARATRAISRGQVAVKLQYRDARSLILADLANIHRVLRVLKPEFAGVVREYRRRVRGEFDYEAEV